MLTVLMHCFALCLSFDSECTDRLTAGGMGVADDAAELHVLVHCHVVHTRYSQHWANQERQHSAF